MLGDVRELRLVADDAVAFDERGLADFEAPAGGVKMHAEIGPVDARLRRAPRRADHLETHTGHQIVRRVPFLEPVDMQAHLFDRFESAGVGLPLGEGRVPAGAAARRLEAQLPNAVFFLSLLEPSQSQRATAEIRRIEALDGGQIFGLNHLGERTQMGNDVFPGVEETPPLLVEMVHCHGRAEIQRDRRKDGSENKNATASGHNRSFFLYEFRSETVSEPRNYEVLSTSSPLSETPDRHKAWCSTKVLRLPAFGVTVK